MIMQSHNGIGTLYYMFGVCYLFSMCTTENMVLNCGSVGWKTLIISHLHKQCSVHNDRAQIYSIVFLEHRYRKMSHSRWKDPSGSSYFTKPHNTCKAFERRRPASPS